MPERSLSSPVCLKRTKKTIIEYEPTDTKWARAKHVIFRYVPSGRTNDQRVVSRERRRLDGADILDNRSAERGGEPSGHTLSVAGGCAVEDTDLHRDRGTSAKRHAGAGWLAGLEVHR